MGHPAKSVPRSGTEDWGIHALGDDGYDMGSFMIVKLADGCYPFVDERLGLSEMTMVEAPPALEALFKAQAIANGVEIIRDAAVELRCQSEEYPDATFLIYWPTGTDQIHILVP